MPNLSSSEIAKLTGLSDRTIRDWQIKNLIPKSDNLAIVISGIVAHLKKQVEEAKADQKGDELYKEKIRLTQAQADKVKLEISEREGELVLAREVIMAWSAFIIGCRAKLLSLPSKLALQLAAISEASEIKGILEETIDEALLELGSEEFVNELESATVYGDGIQTTAEADR